MIRGAKVEDAGAICSIYNPYIVGTTITFEEQEVLPTTMGARIAEVTAALPWLVFEQDGEIGGYAYAASWRVRASYRFSVETAIYLAPKFQKQGMGRALYSELIAKLRGMGIHRAMGGIALPNAGSVALHEGLGFKKVAHFEEVGWKFDRWIDVGYWQLCL